MGTMIQGYKTYTEIGNKIAALGKRQTDIARVLGVSQQTISKKLRGGCAILVSDLETLSKAYGIPLTYFFEEEPGDAEFAQALERIKTSAELRNLVIHASQLRGGDLRKFLAITKAVGE